MKFFTSVFFHKSTPPRPLFEYGFEFVKKIDYEISDFCHSGVIGTKHSLVNLHILCVKVIGIVQDNLSTVCVLF
jgi:hypothetical protein